MNKLFCLHPYHLRLPSGQRAFTLLELVISALVLAVAMIGVGLAMAKATYSSDLDHDRTVAHIAAEQIFQAIDGDVGTSFACIRSGGSWASSTFTVSDLITGGASAGSGYVTTTDLGWDGVTGASIQVRVQVISRGVVYANLAKVYVPQ